jgi:hypothetical protein
MQLAGGFPAPAALRDSADREECQRPQMEPLRGAIAAIGGLRPLTAFRAECCAQKLPPSRGNSIGAGIPLKPREIQDWRLPRGV